ncbi:MULTISPECIES: hypothetical protein [Arthrobacter]|uniref:Uncharacterized protein n=1 Tax=Arthrobacter psychrochitiniphilus TaxID=291045 RepID=A0A2V3DQ02_9MICC|nr:MULTISPECIES: hypothetical protein [Arthrobacter]NYG18574.1 uncharacterized membrane protein HdeD (DUF308 family) [Arthrobacter psychrochitiniphilus]PXA64376.1 hypothetical protein CVS29_15725 [Arthrobacter psychrochitiniphilus]
MTLETPQQDTAMKRTFGDHARALPALLAKAPAWVVLLVGVLCVWLGYELATKPLSSLGALTFYVGASFLRRLS